MERGSFSGLSCPLIALKSCVRGLLTLGIVSSMIPRQKSGDWWGKNMQKDFGKR